MTWIRPHLVDKPHWVYQVFDELGRLLYVGCTYLPPVDRISYLQVQYCWTIGRRATHWTAEQFPDGLTAQVHEGHLIDWFEPPVNGARSAVTLRKHVAPEPPVAIDSGLVKPPGKLLKQLLREAS